MQWRLKWRSSMLFHEIISKMWTSCSHIPLQVGYFWYIEHFKCILNAFFNSYCNKQCWDNNVTHLIMSIIIFDSSDGSENYVNCLSNGIMTCDVGRSIQVTLLPHNYSLNRPLLCHSSNWGIMCYDLGKNVQVRAGMD